MTQVSASLPLVDSSAPFWGRVLARSQAVGSELGRRVALARQVAPPGAVGPRLPLMLAELGAIAGGWGSEALQAAGRNWAVAAVPPAHRSCAVVLVPGFGTHPYRMNRMRKGLEAAGHRVADWGLGFNLGADADRFGRLVERIEAIARHEGEPVVLLGWSLGGLYARQAAKAAGPAVGKVITMGSPFSGDLRANNAWRAYQAIAGHTLEEAPLRDGLTEKPAVPTVALWSPRDGIVAPRCARGKREERDRAVAVRCTHMGFAGHPLAVAAVLAELDRAD